MTESVGDPANSAPEQTVLDMTITTAGFDIPGPQQRPAGTVTFRVRTPDAEGHKLAVIAINNGVSTPDFLAALARSFSWDPETKSAAARIVRRDGRFLGGVYCSAEHAAPELTLDLEPGTYYFLDYDRVHEPDFADSVRVLEVVAGGGTPSSSASPVDSIVTLIADDQQLVHFDVEEPLPSTGVFLFRNATDHLQEAVFGRMASGATEEDISKAIHSYRGGPPLDKEVFVGGGAGMLPLSPGEQAILRLDLSPGRYGLCSYTTNPHTGICNALQHARRCVTLT
ncbi:hypothetical protein EV191_101718 [Tamaricihabitans halophyticus]|uniref:Uncharacterized protein n=1 Tax=Tamaricihabitans halophyticus TaxID=1262583 RepID=A0A4R2R232_9PSEU|nr:hypothetical protein [Tamaricihabitans halophyticus]TCP56772.1 hypothetical protein EV191_101718 [Tamaricihabitans halophyticus]